jgi:hypothetical protein
MSLLFASVIPSQSRPNILSTTQEKNVSKSHQCPVDNIIFRCIVFMIIVLNHDKRIFTDSLRLGG